MSERLEQLDCNTISSIVPLDKTQCRDYLAALSEHWKFLDAHQVLHGNFSFSDYPSAINFVNEVAQLAQQQDHHPSITLDYASCEIRFFTHTLNAISIKDFICAAKIDRLFD